MAAAVALLLVLAACGAAPASVAPASTAATAQPPTAPPATSEAPAVTPSPEPSESAAAYPDNIGEGVTVAILDRGIDWRHPDFVNPDGTTRIRAIYDMTGQQQCNAGNPEPVEISADEINAALASGGNLPHRDAVGHGTATAGMAAGNGSALEGAPFRGVAPGADLVIVKVTSEGVPEGPEHAAEAAFNACMDQALDWLDAKITELGQPAVALWNAGTQWGPMDGTSAVSRKIASVFGPDRPGRVWVASSGDEGSIPNHAGGTYGPGEPLEVRFDKKDPLSYVTAWYSGEAPAKVSFEFADGTVVTSTGPGTNTQANGVTIIQYAPGTAFYPWESPNGDVAVWISIEGHIGEGTIRIETAGNASGTIDVYGDMLGSEHLTSSIDFLDHLVPGRVNDVTSTPGVIGVAVHVVRHTYVDVLGTSRDLSHEGRTGELWLKSSGGPTRDGRQVIDISAPGQNAYAPLAEGSLWASRPGTHPREGEGKYIRFGGTSAAGPIVVGTVALMLEVNPTLTADDVREILHATAIADEFTGTVPNPDWGYGKLDIVAAVEAAASQ